MPASSAPGPTLDRSRQPGSHAMPCWNVAELVDVPTGKRRFLQILGPGLVMGAAAIGGGEWLSGPAVTAKYGPTLLWIATVSILFQVIYNIEISRYTLYTGEPIFSGKLRIAPSPWFWVVFYLMLDFGSVIPYLANNAAIPLLMVFQGRLPGPEDQLVVRIITSLIVLTIMVPLLFGGKIYNSLKIVMTLKLTLVVGFLLVLGVFFTRPTTWWEIVTGMLHFGSIPVMRDEDKNGNGVLDVGEDFDGDGRLDTIEPLEYNDKHAVTGFTDRDGDGIRDGVNVHNVWSSLLGGEKFPPIDFSMIAVIAGLAAIAGNGGLTNTPISNFTRDQGWGMGHHVGAIASVVGGQGVSLSHVGSVFEINEESLPRWKRWLSKVRREQLGIWMLACMVGAALPSILSVEFLPRGTNAKDWSGAAMTANGVREHVMHPRSDVLISQLGWKDSVCGPAFGNIMWTATLLCGFLVMGTSQLTTMDGFVRRWVDVIWTASPWMHGMRTDSVGYVYFAVLLGVGTLGVILVWLGDSPLFLFKLCTTGYNFAFAMSSAHTIVVNRTLLPSAIRPGWMICTVMGVACIFYSGLGVVASLQILRDLGFLSNS
ncbi:MAG: Nramp family divalent metal transporter [Planctomycetota bacterium]|nr:Nramp family divalent metal transporter [Planctomycetota bacterium]